MNDEGQMTKEAPSPNHQKLCGTDQARSQNQFQKSRCSLTAENPDDSKIKSGAEVFGFRHWNIFSSFSILDVLRCFHCTDKF